MTPKKKTRRQRMSTPHGELRSPWDELGATGQFATEHVWRLRWLLYSYPGRGKTTFAAGIPRNLVLDCQAKATAVAYHPTSRRFPCSSMEDLTAALELLEKQGQAGEREFDLVTIDTIPSFIQIVTNHLSHKYRNKIKAPSKSIEDYGEKGKGHNLINNEVKGFLSRIDYAGYGWLATGHVNMSRGTNSDGQEIMIPELTVKPGVLKYIMEEAHFAGQIISKVDRKTGDRRFLSFDLHSNTTPVKTPFPLVLDGQDLGRLELPFFGAADIIQRLYEESAAAFEERIKNRDVRIATPLSTPPRTGREQKKEEERGEENSSETRRCFKRRIPRSRRN